jgi:hypothetical protein
MQAIAIFKNCVLFRLKIQCFGNRRKGELSDEAVVQIIGPASYGQSVEEREKQIGSAKRRLKLGKALINAEEFDKIKEFQTGVRDNLLSKYCNRSFIDEGLYAVKADVVPKVEEEIRSAQLQLQNEFVPAFVAVYPAKVDEARKVFNGQFRDKDYPLAEQLPSLFGFSYRWVKLDVPEGLPPEIREQEEKKLRDTYAQAQEAIQGALWTEFAKFLEHVTDRLEPGADGKRKTFRDTLFTDLSQFVEAFGNRNAFNDDKLGALVAQTQAAIASIGGKTPAEAATMMRDFEGLRDKTATVFAKVKDEVDKTIAAMPKRAFSIDED